MKISRSLSLAITLLPVLIAGLYLFGSAFYDGYLSIFGLDSTMFQASREKTLVLGFFTLEFAAAGSPPYIIVMLLAYVAFLAFAIFFHSYNITERALNRIRIAFPRKQTTGEKRGAVKLETPDALKPVISKTSDYLGYLMLGTAAILLLIVTSLIAYRSGQNSAQDEIDAFANHTSRRITLEGLDFYPILCNEDFCALWTGKHTLQVDRNKLNNATILPRKR